jgi:hypothetical protein
MKRAVLALACAVAAIAAGRAAPLSIDDAFNRFWDAHNPDAAAKAAQDVVTSGVTFEDARARLKHGRAYSPQVKKGGVRLQRRSVSGDFAYDLLIPESYDPAHVYTVRFQLHGGVMMRESGSGDSRNSQGGRAGGRGSPLLGDEQIYVMPSAWRDAPWWSRAQLENLDAILDAVKRTYNVDENHVVVSGVSDGATGALFFAMRDTTPFASFLTLNGFLMVLANDSLDVGGELFPTNLRNKPVFAVNGGHDPLYPIHAVQPYIDHLKRSGVALEFHPRPEAGHNTAWWPEMKDSFESFVRTHPRIPFPSSLTWEVTDQQMPGRAHWLVIDKLMASREPRLEPDLNIFTGDGSNRGLELFARGRPSGRVDLAKNGNSVALATRGVAEVTLLISPDAFDMSQPIVVIANGRRVLEQRVETSLATLMKWAARDNDRTMLFGAELHVGLK